MITINPKKVECQGHWEHKREGVIFVEKKEDINKLFDLLVDQDDYWEGRKNLIRVAPKIIDDIKELEQHCEYVGKTDIYDVELLKTQVNFLIFQYEKYPYC